ncbi:MAG: SiaB family protein kinase [Blastocatellia bacterium]|nr:SiaB family protein kinase [Blastocatellia bacterium]
MTQDIFALYQRYCNQKVFLAFKGPLSQEILVELGDFLKTKLIVDKKVKKVFHIFIEMAQNVLHYSVEREEIGDTGIEVGVGLVMVTETADNYLVISCNKAEIQQAEKIKAHCDTINQASEEELKRLFSEQRRGFPADGSKGAGLGFIDMRRKSDRPLEYALHPIDEKFVFLTLTVTIEKGN